MNIFRSRISFRSLLFFAATATALTGLSAEADCPGSLLCATYDYNLPVTITTSSISPAFTVMGGNVGFGTTTPGQALSVVGVIESTTGGFKFPDGTIQTTASTGSGGGTGTVTDIETGTGLTGGPITSTGTLSLADFGTAGTYTKVTVDSKGRVQSGAALTASDLPTLPSTQISGLGTAAALNAGTAAGNLVQLDGTGHIPSSLVTGGGGGGSSQWTTSGTAIYYNNGWVGIGTSAPTVPLEVSGAMDITRTDADAYGGSTVIRKSRNGAIVQNNDEIGYVRFDAFDGSAYQKAAGVIAEVDGTPSAGNVPGRIIFVTSSTEKMRITGGGNVGIGTPTPAYKLDVNGAIHATSFATTGGMQIATNGDIYMPWAKNYLSTVVSQTGLSDVRLKKDIQPLDETDGLAMILRLQPVSFHWKDSRKDVSEGTQIGFIAQDVEKIEPHLVRTLDKPITVENGSEKEVVQNPKAINYQSMVAPLVKAVQELHAENQQLRRELEDLKKNMR